MGSTARSALIATSIGVTAMIVAMALMTGYREELQLKLIRGNAAVVVYPLSDGGLDLSSERAAEIQRLPGVEAVRGVLYGQGSLGRHGESGSVDVTLRGISLAAAAIDPFVVGASGTIRASSGSNELPDVLLGAGLAESLSVASGDSLRLMVLGARDGRPRFGYRSVRVAGTFTAGLSEFDRHLAVLELSVLEALVGLGVGDVFFEVVVAEDERVGVVADGVRGAIGPDFLVTDWRELNRELFTALKLQQVALFLVLGLIVVVSTFNVASSLVVLVREKMRDVGALAALGLAPRHLRAVFLLFGGLLAAAGTLLGVGLGATVSWVLTRFELIRFEADVAAIYFLSSVPFRLRGLDLAAIVTFTLLLALVACWLPARRAGRIEPAAALRYE